MGRNLSTDGAQTTDTVELVTQLVEGAVDPTQLTTEQRRQCVELLALDRHVTRRRVASLLKIHLRTVQQDIFRIQERAGKQLRKSLAGDATAKEASLFLRRNTEIYNTAVNSGDFSLARLVATDRPRMLLDLGVIGPDPGLYDGGHREAVPPTINVAIVLECDAALKSRFGTPVAVPTNSSDGSISVTSGSG